MYEQVAASRNRMAQQLSAANRHVTFLETALESRRGEVAAAMDSMHSLTQVRNILCRNMSAGTLVRKSWVLEWPC